MLRFMKVQHVGVSPNKRASLYRATHSKMFFVLVPQTVLIELILEEPKSGKEGKAILGVARPLRQDKLATWLRVT